MPRSQQIIPEYSVPHVSTYINDNSTVSTVTPIVATEPNVRFLYVFTSPKGEDCTIKDISDTETYLKTYGTPNMALYGQAGYMPYLSLASGRAKCYCVRVMPYDAKYANLFVTATIDSTGESGITVTFAAETVNDLVRNDRTSLATVAAGIETSTKKVLFAVASKGRGVYGNNLGIRVVTDTYYDANNNYKNYVFEVIDGENNVFVRHYFIGTFIPESVVSSKTIYLEDVVTDPATGDTDVNLYVNNAGFDALYAAYVAGLDEGVAAVPQNEFDYLYGKPRGVTDNSTVAGYTVANNAAGYSGFKFDTTTGTSLSSGTDGSFASINANRATAIENEYLKALYSGTDSEFMAHFGATVNTEGRRYRGINSKRRTPIQIVLDANYSTPVKQALVTLAKTRNDAKLFLDSGVNDTITALNTADDTISGGHTAATYNFSNDFFMERLGQCYSTRDPFNNKVITVTATYALAQMIPTHYINVGNHIPMVGENYAIIPGVIAGSMRPNIDADDLDTKEDLYSRRINTIDTLSDYKYIISTQVTSQSVISDLSEGNNVAVLYDMKRALENLVLAKIYEFAEAEDRARFTEDAESLFNPYRNTKVRDFKVRFDMNPFEAERNILHCYLEVTFKQISTRGIIEIDINKRAV